MHSSILNVVDTPTVVPLASSSHGRLSGKGWKAQKGTTSRWHLPRGVKAKSWQDRMQMTQKALAIKKLQNELHEEKQVERQRRKDITLQRKRAAEERARIDEAKAKMGARKAARLRRKTGRVKKING